MNAYDSSVKFLAGANDFLRLGGSEPSRKLVNSLKYLNKDESLAGRVSKASRLLFLISVFSGLLALVFYGFNVMNVMFIVILGVFVNHFYSEYYKNKCEEERIRDLSRLPDFFSLLITNLKINPSFENNLDFASGYEFGRVSKELRKLILGVNTGKEYDVKKSFLEIMKGFDNSVVFNAANLLISSLSVRNSDRRNQLLEKSLSALLKGVVDESRKYANNIYLPVLLIFSFGTIVPLIIISVIPIISFFQSSLFNMANITFLFLLNIIGTYFLVNNLQNRSPPRFSQVFIEYEEKGVNLFLLFVLFLGVSFPTFIFFFSQQLGFVFSLLNGFQTLFLYAGLCLSIGLYYYSKSYKLLKAKKELQELENGLISAFYSVGAKIGEGNSVEKSIKWVEGIVEDEKVKDFFKKANLLISRGVDLRKVFSKAHVHGSLSSYRIRSLMDLFVNSVTKHSKAASENVITICDFYSRIMDAEKELANIMSKNSEMIRLTNLFFTPFICALVINIQELLNKSLSENVYSFIGFNFLPLNNEYILLVVSMYVLGLNFMLSRLYSFIASGNEKVYSMFNLGVSLFVSGIVFTATLIITRFVL